MEHGQIQVLIVNIMCLSIILINLHTKKLIFFDRFTAEQNNLFRIAILSAKNVLEWMGKIGIWVCPLLMVRLFFTRLEVVQSLLL